jgi:hypothetical protein
VSSVKYELGFYIPEDDIPPSHRRENLKCNKVTFRLPAQFGDDWRLLGNSSAPWNEPAMHVVVG